MDNEINCENSFDKIVKALYDKLIFEEYYREDSETGDMRLYNTSECNEIEVTDFIGSWFNENKDKFLIQDFNIELVEAWSSISLDVYVLCISWINENNKIECINEIIWWN